MLAPDQLPKANAWNAKDIVRISLESKGIIGFVEVADMQKLTLEQARPLIQQYVEDAPLEFQFMLDGGVPLSRRQETTHHVSDHYPCLRIRATKKKATKSNKFTVYNAIGEEFETWVPSDYNFGQLRRDAARFWNISDLTNLVDDDGCVWPDEANIFALLESDELRMKRVILLTKSNVQTTTPKDNRRTRVQINYEERLWYIFTYYCVHGDALDLLTMTAYQFNRFLKDCGLFNSKSFTPAMGDIIYAFEGKGKLSKQQQTTNSKTIKQTSRGTSGKLDYDGFLNAIHTIATRFRPHLGPDDALTDLLVHYVLPNANAWAIHTWQTHSEALRQNDVQRFTSKFTSSLTDIFMFYTNQPLAESTDAGNYWMTFTDCMRFLQDFRFTELLLTTQECPELFLAACHGTCSDSDEPLVARESMSFEAFVSMLGHAGLVSISRHRRVQPLQCVKAVFHHMTRSLRGSRALDIIQNHGPVAIYASRFYSGSVAFSNKFLDMWRIEGSPDYVTGNLPQAAPTLTKGRQSIHQIVQIPTAPDAPAAVHPMPPSPPQPIQSHGGQSPVKEEKILPDNDGRAILRKGAIFRKYGTWNAPHRRFVWLNDDATFLHWRPLNKPDQLNEGIALRSVQSLLTGNTDATRYAFMKYLSEEKYVQRCFSIVAKDRRLDLEAESEAVRDEWVAALRSLLPRAKFTV